MAGSGAHRPARSRRRTRRGATWSALLAVALGALGCASSGGTSGAGFSSASSGGTGTAEDRSAAWTRLIGDLDDFAVGGAVRTDDGLLLPETITIRITSEICVESRQPGSRFWSLDYDTCFVFSDVDTVGPTGQYSVRVPCTDADRSYVSRHAFGDLRLVQRGPVSFLAESDAGWKHQETFTSSRYQRRDLVLTLDTDVFWVIGDEAFLCPRPAQTAEVLGRYGFGTPVEVVRFHAGWAQVRMGRLLGWMDMRVLGTEAEMKEKAPFKGKSPPRPAPDGS